MSDPLLPNSLLVAKHWLLAAVGGLDQNVATTLPDPPWHNDEFLQVMNVGGAPDLDVPMFHPVVSVNCFAMKPNSTKPPWGRAAQLGMRVIKATYQIAYAPSTRVELNLPDGYGRAIVHSVSAVSDLREIPSDPSQYAAYNLDLAIHWTPASLVVT
jgi:hypothetical protein